MYWNKEKTTLSFDLLKLIVSKYFTYTYVCIYVPKAVDINLVYMYMYFVIQITYLVCSLFVFIKWNINITLKYK